MEEAGRLRGDTDMAMVLVSDQRVGHEKPRAQMVVVFRVYRG